jgi:hypothetical protein
MEIAEGALLDGLDSISNDGYTAQSIVDGVRVWWTYRTRDSSGGQGCVTEERGQADMITLANGRIGEIQLDKKITPAQEAAAATHADRARAIWSANISAAAAALGRKGGLVKSEKKAASSRENGKKGGRHKAEKTEGEQK